MTETWEYFTTILTAWLSEDALTVLSQMDVDVRDMPMNAPESMVPALNNLGAKGWELVHMVPVVVGGKRDIAIFHGVGQLQKVWTSEYFCAFKRRKPAP